MNNHQRNAQYSGVRDGDAPPDRNVQPILRCGSTHPHNRIVVALLDAVYVVSSISKGVMNGSRTNRTEEL